MIAADAVTCLQPSVAKVGGVTGFVAVAALAQAHGKAVMPHSPFFGVGHFTTLQRMAGLHGKPLFEHLYLQLDADLAVGGTPLPAGGMVAIPQRPVHGFEPDRAARRGHRRCQPHPAVRPAKAPVAGPQVCAAGRRWPDWWT